MNILGLCRNQCIHSWAGDDREVICCGDLLNHCTPISAHYGAPGLF